MLFTRKTSFLAAAILLATPSLALAHPGHGAEGGFGPGFMHPLSGLDHLLATVAVALLAFRMGGRNLWAVPAAFLASGVLGGTLAWAGTSLPLVEVMLIGSVLLGGLFLARHRDVPVPAAVVMPLFGVFHGHAHVAEMSSLTSLAGYSAGLLLASAAMIGGTILLATMIKAYRSEQTVASIYRVLGSGFCAAAFVMMMSQLA